MLETEALDLAADLRIDAFAVDEADDGDRGIEEAGYQPEDPVEGAFPRGIHSPDTAQVDPMLSLTIIMHGRNLSVQGLQLGRIPRPSAERGARQCAAPD
jgi:hypothetical protein